MTYNTSTYDNLYENLKNRFTVENDNLECTLGEYMLAKADETSSALPVAVSERSSGKDVVLSLASFVSEKLTIKKEPAKDKTMRAFPLRTALASLASAFLLCTIVVTYGLAGNSELNADSESANASYEIEAVDSYDEEVPAYTAETASF